MSDAEMTDPELEELAARAAPLDALLVDAALGPMRWLAPNSSTVGCGLYRSPPDSASPTPST